MKSVLALILLLTSLELGGGEDGINVMEEGGSDLNRTIRHFSSHRHTSGTKTFFFSHYQ